MNMGSVVTNSIVSIAFAYAGMSLLYRLGFNGFRAFTISVSIWIVWIFSINYVARYTLDLLKELIRQMAN